MLCSVLILDSGPHDFWEKVAKLSLPSKYCLGLFGTDKRFNNGAIKFSDRITLYSGFISCMRINLRVSRDLSEVQLQTLKSGEVLDRGGSQSLNFKLLAWE
jgi:hypothetical protein